MLIPQPVVFAQEHHRDLLRPVLAQRTLFVNNRREFFGAMFTRGAVAIVDLELLDLIDGGRIDAPIIALIDVPANEALVATIRALESYPWLSHVIQAPLLSLERARHHLEQMIERVLTGRESPHDASAVGRVALLARSSRRHQRFDRIREYFVEQGASERVTTTLLDVGEELVMNGLYNAPQEAGFFGRVHTRDEDVELPPDRACEISYGVDDTSVFMRLRDKFGALHRKRLLEVLTRCSTSAVELDVSRGGAGLGLWRIFSAASAVTVSVTPGVVTDITVAIGKNDSRRIARPLSVDLHFRESRATWQSPLEERLHSLLDNSITLAIGNTPTPTPTPR